MTGTDPEDDDTVDVKRQGWQLPDGGEPVPLEGAAAKPDPDETTALVLRLREANQQLLLSSVRAQELADDAVDARGLALLSELRLRALVDSVAAIVWAADARGWVVFAPQPWADLTGLVAAERPGEWDWLSAVHAGDRVRVRAAWASSVATGMPYDCEFRLRLREGGSAWTRSRAVPIRQEGGPVLEWMGMLVDTRERSLETAARERFVGVMSHDLRTPLSTIRLGADDLATDALTTRQLRTVALIRGGVTRLDHAIADVLDFARGRLGGGISLSLATVHFGKICRDVLPALCAAYPTRTIHLETRGDLIGRWDAERVAQVVTNLVSHAVAHGPGAVLVSVADMGDEVELSVQNETVERDQDAEPLDPVIALDRRGGFEEGTRTPALGLGLHIANQIVLAHEGTLEARSSAGGTTCLSRWSRHLQRSAMEPDPPPGRGPAAPRSGG